MATAADKSGEVLEAVLAAVEASLVGDDGDPIVDVEKLVDGLVEANLRTTPTTNRGSLAAELSYIREERRVMIVRRDNAEDDEARSEFAAIVEKIDAREQEIQGLLWP